MMRSRYPSIGSIYKAWFGKKYLIWKGKSLHQSVEMIAKEIDNRMRLGLKPADAFTKVVEYIKRARVNLFEVEAVFQSDNPAELLIEEYRQLKASQDDPDCLNMQFYPAIPQWVPGTAKDEFQAYVAKITAESKKLAKKKASVSKKVVPPKKKQGLKSKKNASGKTLRSVNRKIKVKGNAKSKSATHNKVRSPRRNRT